MHFYLKQEKNYVYGGNYRTVGNTAMLLPFIYGGDKCIDFLRTEPTPNRNIYCSRIFPIGYTRKNCEQSRLHV